MYKLIICMTVVLLMSPVESLYLAGHLRTKKVRSCIPYKLHIHTIDRFTFAELGILGEILFSVRSWATKVQIRLSLCKTIPRRTAAGDQMTSINIII